jgi:hypothetical protein
MTIHTRLPEMALRGGVPPIASVRMCRSDCTWHPYEKAKGRQWYTKKDSQGRVSFF